MGIEEIIVKLYSIHFIIFIQYITLLCMLWLWLLVNKKIPQKAVYASEVLYL